MHNDNNNIDGIIKKSDERKQSEKQIKNNNTMQVLKNDTIVKQKFAKP